MSYFLTQFSSMFMSVPHCFDYCSFVLSFEIKMCESSGFVLFQDCFGYLWSLEILYVSICMPAKSLQLCPTLYNARYCSPPGSSVHGILQARRLECVAMLSSGESS